MSGRSPPRGAYERLIAGMTWHDASNPVRAIRTRRFKYVRNFRRLSNVSLPRDVADSSAGEEVSDEFERPNRPSEELYDLEVDPHECENVADEAGYEGLRGELREWMERTDDPLLEGLVPQDDGEATMTRPPE